MTSAPRTESIAPKADENFTSDELRDPKLSIPPSPAEIEAAVERCLTRSEAFNRENPKASRLIRESIRDAEEAGRL